MLKSKTPNRKLIEDGNWSVWEGNTVLDKNLFYYILDPKGERLYFFIIATKEWLISKELKSNCKKYLKNERIPESIKDFIRSVIILNEL